MHSLIFLTFSYTCAVLYTWFYTLSNISQRSSNISAQIVLIIFFRCILLYLTDVPQFIQIVYNGRALGLFYYNNGGMHIYIYIVFDIWRRGTDKQNTSEMQQVILYSSRQQHLTMSVSDNLASHSPLNSFQSGFCMKEQHLRRLTGNRKHSTYIEAC